MSLWTLMKSSVLPAKCQLLLQINNELFSNCWLVLNGFLYNFKNFLLNFEWSTIYGNEECLSKYNSVWY